MSQGFEAMGESPDALFTLRLHQGDGMVLLDMNWKVRPPHDDFVIFAIQYRSQVGAGSYPLRTA